MIQLDHASSAQRTPIVLRSIALFEGAKGLLAIMVVCGIIFLRHTDLHAATVTFLLRHGIDPEQYHPRLLVESVSKVTNLSVVKTSALGCAYALIRLTVGIGLWRGSHWAEWLAVISAGLYLPWEFQHLVRHPTLLVIGVICFNVAIILYMLECLKGQRVERNRNMGRTKCVGQ
jgi:uncharacterized membrane protein (DUF2068 family)